MKHEFTLIREERHFHLYKCKVCKKTLKRVNGLIGWKDQEDLPECSGAPKLSWSQFALLDWLVQREDDAVPWESSWERAKGWRIDDIKECWRQLLRLGYVEPDACCWTPNASGRAVLKEIQESDSEISPR